MLRFVELILERNSWRLKVTQVKPELEVALLQLGVCFHIAGCYHSTLRDEKVLAIALTAKRDTAYIRERKGALPPAN